MDPYHVEEEVKKIVILSSKTPIKSILYTSESFFFFFG